MGDIVLNAPIFNFILSISCPISNNSARELPTHPNQYSNAYCGRFNIGFGATDTIRNDVAGSKPSRF